MPPHVYAVAESSYYNMNAYKDNQCIIIRSVISIVPSIGTSQLTQAVVNPAPAKPKQQSG